MSILVSLCGMLRLIRVDTLRRDHNAGFLAGRLNCVCAQVSNCMEQFKLGFMISINRMKEKMLGKQILLGSLIYGLLKMVIGN